MDLDSRVKEKNAGLLDEILLKATEHFVKDHVTNEEVGRRIQAVNRECDELLTLVKKWKLRWFGNVPRSSCLAKTFLQGTVKA